MFSSDKNDLIILLQKLLNYVIYSTVLLAFGVLFNLDALYLFGILTIIFIVYMLFVLFEAKRYGWIITFLIMLGIPSLALYIIDESHKPKSAMTASPTVVGIVMMLEMLILILYILYCYMLKVAMREWPDV